MRVPAPSRYVLLVQRDNDQLEGSIVELSYPMNQMPVNRNEACIMPDLDMIRLLIRGYI